MLTWFAVVVILVALVALFFFWLLVISEGAYLGPRFVTWLYDRSARRYDTIKQFVDDDEDWYLGIPLGRAMMDIRRPLLLDVATGTGRLPLTLLRRYRFDGQVVALDYSRQMLKVALEKLASHLDRLTLLRQDATCLPFPDETFDAVACLEALEFFPNPIKVLREMVRVLRPGGVLMTTNRVGWEAHLLPGKTLSRKRLRAVLGGLPLQAVEVRRWQVVYDLVWARKEGSVYSDGNGGLTLSNFLLCPHCSGSLLQASPTVWQCSACRHIYPVLAGILCLADGSQVGSNSE